MGEKTPKKKHSFRAAFLTGLVAILILATGLFFGVRAIWLGTREPEMLYPDYVSGDDGEVLPSLDPNLADIKVGDYVYDGLIALIAKHDMPVFQSADELPDSMLLSFSIWAALRSDTYREAVTMREDGTIFIPAAVVEKSMADHFYVTRQVVHQSVSVYTDFTYSEEEGGYTVWATGVDTKYLPRVAAISHEGETYQIKLDYVDIERLGDAELTPETPSAKSVAVVLSGSGKDYRLLSLALLSAPEGG